jgi:hypothetical protein
LALAAVVGNLPWLWPSLRFRHLMTGMLTLGQANPLFALSDYADLLLNPLTTGYVAPKTMFRFLALLGGIVGVWRLRRARDPRALPLAVGVGWGLLLSYLGTWVWPLGYSEPYRYIAPTALLAVIPAASFLDEALFRPWFRQLPRVARAVVALLCLLLLPRLFGQIAYFLPEMVPEASRTPSPGRPARGALAAANLGLTTFARQVGLDPDARELRRWLRANADGSGRIAVQFWPLAEMLRWSTDLPIIGGFPDRRLLHEQADCFRLPQDARREGPAFADYLTTYNVGYLVLTARAPAIEGRTDLLEYRTRIGPHRIYRTLQPPGYVLGGRGEVVAGLNRIEVSGASSELVLKFHWLDSLRCTPGCTIQREPLPGDDAGFIRVSGAPPSFVIENAY